MNTEIILTLDEFKANDIRGLVLVNELSENVGTLGMSLSPSLSFSVVQLKTQDSLSELAHNGSPQKNVDLVSLPIEERVDVW